jgi:hypothetical protein
MPALLAYPKHFEFTLGEFDLANAEQLERTLKFRRIELRWLLERKGLEPRSLSRLDDRLARAIQIGIHEP